MLGAGSVTLVVDVRTVPRSRTNPQYDADTLPATLSGRHIGYMRIPDLGGLRKRSADVPPEVNGYWENRSFHNYADYALSDQFSRALDDLEEIADREATVIMCSEAVWWRCHRRIIADYLMLRGRRVFHLMDSNRVDPATMTPAAVNKGAHLIYPREACITNL